MNKIYSAFKHAFGVSHKRIIQKQLEDAQIDFLDHCKSEEYHAAMKQMLHKRITRLTSLLNKLDK